MRFIITLTIFAFSNLAFGQIQKGQDIDGEATGDASGISVSMPDVNTLAIGARLNDGSGTDAGHVRIYNWNGSSWVQQGQDINGEAPGDNSGHSISMPNTTTIAIGAFNNDGSFNSAGHVRIYSWNGTAWTQKGADIDGEAGFDYSGYSVSMPDENTVAIGAHNNDGSGTDAGHVRVYAWNGISWVQKGTDINGEAAGDNSGRAVSMPDANTVAIGAYLNDGSGTNAGHVRIYSWNGTAWTQKGVDIDGEAAGDNSGSYVNMPDANTVAIGASSNGGNGASSGHVRVYSWNGSSWIQKGQDINGEAAYDYSGAVDMWDANTLAIGAGGNDGNGSSAGQARVYKWNGTIWIQQGSDINGEAANDNFGYSVCMANAYTFAAGATGNDGSGIDAGHVRIYSMCISTSSSISPSSCNNYTAPDGTVYTTSGTYTAVIPNAAGCDSTITINLTINSVPSQPSSISGASTVCSGSSQTYSVTNVAGVTYNWSFPAGWTQTSGGTSNSITVTVGASSGNISVTPSNSCGNGSTISLAATLTSTPAQPSTISGNSVVCPGQVVTYSVTNDPAATSYSWSVPAGWSILPPSNTNSVTLAVGGSTGVISVTANNSCGSSTAQTFNVVVSTPPVQPSTVVGNTTVCSGTLNTYSVTNDANALSYTWTLPSGWSGSSTTNSIAATAGTTGGNVSVVANYFCGTSAPSSISVNVNVPPAQPSAISGLSEFCEDNLSQNYSVTNDANGTSYTWTLPGGWSGSSTSNSIITTATSNGGTITVFASNSCGNSPAQSATIVVNPLPTVNYVQNPSLVCINYAPFELSSATPAGGNYSGFGVNGTTFDPTAAGIGNHLISYFYTDANGCSAMTSDIITVDDCAGIVETEVEVIRVFPNPTNGLITVQSDNEEIQVIKIYDLTGSLLETYIDNGSVVKLDMGQYSSGVYRLVCLSNNSISVVKLIKQ